MCNDIYVNSPFMQRWRPKFPTKNMIKKILSRELKKTTMKKKLMKKKITQKYKKICFEEAQLVQ